MFRFDVEWLVSDTVVGYLLFGFVITCVFVLIVLAWVGCSAFLYALCCDAGLMCLEY